MVVQTLACAEPGGRWSPSALELLGDASALARRWAGRVGAWFLTAPGAVAPDLSELAAHGCDVVWQLSNERFAGWCSEAAATALARYLSPACRVVLLPAGARGEEVAALLAERLETTWVPDALTMAVTRTGAPEVTAAAHGGKLSRAYRPAADRPAVVTMREGVAEARRVDRPRPPEVRAVAVDLSDVPVLTAVEGFLPADPRTVAIALARRVVSAGRGAGGPDGLRAIAGLADALGAALGASRLAVDLGWAPPERQVGQTGHTVRPDLYVACGVSGASHHLAGMRESKHIVAINPDASAPIHAVAHLSLYGDLHQVIPAVHAALERRFPPAPEVGR